MAPNAARANITLVTIFAHQFGSGVALGIYGYLLPIFQGKKTYPLIENQDGNITHPLNGCCISKCFCHVLSNYRFIQP